MPARLRASLARIPPLAGRARLEHPGITITIHDPIPIARTMTRVKWSPEGDPVGI
ncbi:hypothetical protein ACFS07_00615 [Undibacterium arcticum]